MTLPYKDCNRQTKKSDYYSKKHPGEDIPLRDIGVRSAACQDLGKIGIGIQDHCFF